MRFLLVLSLFILPPIRLGLRDCTKDFKGRVASFEYAYCPGYWLYPYWPDLLSSGGAMIGYSTLGSLKKDKTYQWILHDCSRRGRHAVCMESNRKGWGGYYFGEIFDSWNLYLDTDLSNGINSLVPMKIFCDSCTPGGPDNHTFSDCQLRTRSGKKIYTSQKGRIYDCDHCGTDDWFRWRVEAPPTGQYWTTIYQHCNNRTNSSTDVSFSVKTSIATSTSETYSTEAKIAAGLAAGKLIRSMTGEQSHAYSRTHMILYVDEKEFELRKTIPSGKKWIVQQLVGRAGYTTINTVKHREEMDKC